MDGVFPEALKTLAEADPEVYELVQAEKKRQWYDCDRNCAAGSSDTNTIMCGCCFFEVQFVSIGDTTRLHSTVVRSYVQFCSLSILQRHVALDHLKECTCTEKSAMQYSWHAVRVVTQWTAVNVAIKGVL